MISPASFNQMSNDYRAKGENEKLVSEDIIFTRSVKGGS